MSTSMILNALVIAFTTALTNLIPEAIAFLLIEDQDEPIGRTISTTSSGGKLLISQSHVLVIHEQSHLQHWWSPTTNAAHEAQHHGGSLRSCSILESSRAKNAKLINSL